jgi:hypothetical protein
LNWSAAKQHKRNSKVGNPIPAHDPNPDRLRLPLASQKLQHCNKSRFHKGNPYLSGMQQRRLERRGRFQQVVSPLMAATFGLRHFQNIRDIRVIRGLEDYIQNLV